MLRQLVEMMEQIQQNGDGYLRVKEGGYSFVIDDFEGFDEDWSEVMRDYVDEGLVEQFEDLLDEFEYEGCLYRHYHVEGVVIELGYSSFDI